MVILGIIVVGILLTVLALAIPVEIEHAYDSQSRQKTTTRIVGFFGLVHFQPDGKKSTWWRRLRQILPPEARRERKTGHKRFQAFIALLQSEGFIHQLLKLLYETLSAARISQFKAGCSFGLDDPADTGRLYGLLAPGLSFLYAIPQVDFVVTPVFDRPVFATNMHIRIRLVPIHYLETVTRFVFSKESYRAAKAAHRAYRR